jgi:putative tricarboxylic transport membrane protein
VFALAILLGSVILYILAGTALGFLPTAFVILVAMMAVLRVPLKRNLLIALVATLAVHFMFYKLLRVPLPWGVLTPFAW